MVNRPTFAKIEPLTRSNTYRLQKHGVRGQLTGAKFGQLILGEIIKIVYLLNCKAILQEILLRLGMCARPLGRARSTTPDLLAGFKWAYNYNG